MLEIKLPYQSIKTQSGTMGYATYGTGQPLILIVGYTGTLFHWNNEFVKHLATKFKVYLVDNRKIGLSDSNNSESLAGLADDIADFIVALDLVKPIIFGWSMGGVLVQELARHHHTKISSLVLMATVPGMNVVSSGFNNLTRNSEKYTEIEYKAQLYYYFFSELPTPDTKSNITKNAVKLENYHYRFNQNAKELQNKVIPQWNGMTVDDYSKIKLPTLILWAKDDLVVPFSAQKFMLDNITPAKLIVYPSGGHFIIHKNPKQIAQDVINFYCRKEVNNV